MQEYPRRTLLGGIGVTIGTALTSHAVTADTDDDEGWDVEVPSDGPDFSSLLEYLPASVAGDELTISAVDYERLLEADEPHDRRPPIGPFAARLDEDASISKVVSVQNREDDFSTPLVVVEGDLDFDEDLDFEDDPESREADDGRTYELYEQEQRGREESVYAAATDDVILVAEDEATIEEAFAANAGEADRLLQEEPALEAGLETYDHADGRFVAVGEELHTPGGVDEGDVGFVVRATTVLDPDTMLIQLGLEFEDADDVTDEVVEGFETEFAYVATKAEPEIEVDGAFVEATAVRDLAAERAAAEHDSPGSLRAREREFDPEEDDSLEVELGRGDPTPVEDLTFEVGDETYDRDVWAGDREQLEEGDVIRIDADDVEPNLDISLRHEHEAGSSASGTTIFNHFRFRFEYDPDAEAAVVEYADEGGLPLDGDRVWLAAYDQDELYRRRPDEDGPDPLASAQPWDGELSVGDDATLEGVRPGDVVIVGWDGDSRRDAIARERVRPPGTVTFEYDYDERTLTATLELDGEQPAGNYELRVDDEPAGAQWTDEYDTLTDDATVEVGDVDVGSHVNVVWTETDARVGGYRVRPPGAASFEYDHEERTLTATLELDGERPAEKYELWLDREPADVQWGEEYDTVEDGDALELEDVEIGSHVTLVWSETEDEIAWYRVEPPGTATVDYDYESGTTTVTLELDGERPAENYELQVDREPVDVQWADEYDTVEDGDTLELEDLEVGTRVDVVWTETGDHVGGGRAAPSIEVELRADEGEFEHAGGDALPASKLEARLHGEDGRETIDLDEEDDVGDTFEDGDVVAFDRADAREVVVIYDDDFHVGGDWHRE